MCVCVCVCVTTLHHHNVYGIFITKLDETYFGAPNIVSLAFARHVLSSQLCNLRTSLILKKASLNFYAYEYES